MVHNLRFTFGKIVKLPEMLCKKVKTFLRVQKFKYIQLFALDFQQVGNEFFLVQPPYSTSIHLSII